MPDLASNYSCMQRQYLFCHKTCCTRTTLKKILESLNRLNKFILGQHSWSCRRPIIWVKNQILRRSKIYDALSTLIDLALDPASCLTFGYLICRVRNPVFFVFCLKYSPWEYGKLHTFLSVLEVEQSRESYHLALPSIYTEVYPETSDILLIRMQANNSN